MSLGTSLLSALLEAGAAAALLDIHDDLFLSDELPSYRFIMEHYRQYGVLPDRATVEAGGHLREVQSPEPLGYYVDEVRKRAAYNQLRDGSAQLQEALAERNVDEAIRLVGDMSGAAQRMEPSGPVAMPEALADVLRSYHLTRDYSYNTITLGWPILDTVTGGMQGGDLITVAGRPNVGKSYVLLKMAHEAWMEGRSVMFYSMEMSARLMARRMFGIMSGVNPMLTRDGTLSIYSEGELVRLVDATRSRPPFHIIEGGFRRSTTDFDVHMRQLAPDVGYIDAAYLLTPRDMGGRVARWEKMANVIEQLKGSALEQDRPVVISVQVNREGEKDIKKNKATVMGLAGSDVIGQVSSVVIVIAPGPAGREKTTRRLSVVKDREGGYLDFAIRFRFDPVDFSYVKDPRAEPSEEDTNVGHML